MMRMVMLKFWTIIFLRKDTISKQIGGLDQGVFAGIAEVGSYFEVVMEERLMENSVIKVLNTGGELFVNTFA